ncbi:MAG: Gfo/Idh/MocA family protein [Rhodospirillales bacterium]
MRAIGLMGAGWVTQHHLRGWQRLADRARVVAIADPNKEAREGRAAEFGIPRAYASAAELLANEKLDAVDVAVPRQHHARVCLLAAKRGLPILCQKPLAPTLAEARALVRGVGRRARLMVHENWRFRTHYLLIRKWLEEGRVGRVRQAVMTILTSGFIPDAEGRLYAVERQPFFRAEKRLLLMEVLIHHVDCLRYLLGELRLDAARLGKSATAIAGEDRAMLMLSGGRGEAVALVGDFMAHGHPPQQFDRLEILGDEGAVRLDGAVLESFGKRPERLAVDHQANYLNAYEGVFRHFLDCLDSGRRFDTRPEDNLKTLAICERAYRTGFFKPGAAKRRPKRR